MGAHFNSMTLDGKLTADQVEKRFNAIRKEERIEHGTDPYNGSFSTLEYVTVRDRVFETTTEAEDYCEEHSEKWENAVAVRAKDITTKTVKKPTFNGRESFYADEEVVYMGRNSENFVAADQLTNGQKVKLKKLFDHYQTCAAALDVAKAPFHDLVKQLEDVKVVFKDYTNLRKTRAVYAAAKKVAKKAEKDFNELESQFRQKLYKSKEVDNGLVWVLGGWCAS